MVASRGNYFPIMKAPPKGWPRLTLSLFYQDASAAIDWLVTAFGFEVRLKVEGEGGKIEYSELVFGDAVVSCGEESGQIAKGRTMRSPKSTGGMVTSAPCIFVDDADAHCARARAAGAKITYEPTTTDYGDEYWSDRSYGVEDLEGHQWWFMQRIRS